MTNPGTYQGLSEQLKLLHDQSLYTNVVTLGEMILSLNESNWESSNILTSFHHTKFQIYVYCANAHFHLGNYKKAESLYKTALQYKKCVLKVKSTSKATMQEVFQQRDVISDIDIKFQIHLCLVKMKRTQEALQTLQSIPAKQRSSKVNMALAKMFEEQGSERSAITSYKEVLRECPFALEAAEGLLGLGVKGVEVHSLLVGNAANLPILDWLNGWIKARAHSHNREYNQAISTLRALDEANVFKDNFALIFTMAECHYYAGDDKNALICMRRARNIEPDVSTGVDIYAALLYKNREVKELESAMPSIIASADASSPEVSTAMGYMLLATRKLNRANALMEHSLSQHPGNFEGIILRGNILLEQKKHVEALQLFRDAMHLKPYRYEPHKGLVDAIVGMHRLREAINIASAACKELGHTPRVLTLYASVLMKDPVSLGKAKNLLSKALAQEETYLPAVYLLAEVYEQEMNLTAAIELLERQTELQPTCKLHQILGDLCSRLHLEEKALEHYTISLNLEPGNRKVREGMHRLHSSSSKLDSTYVTMGEEHAETTYDVGEGLQETDNEDGPEESETEAQWSDMDIEANNSQ